MISFASKTNCCFEFLRTLRISSEYFPVEIGSEYLYRDK